MQPDDSTGGTISIPRVREARDMVYSGPLESPTPAAAESASTSPSRNRRATRRRVSPFNLIVILLGVAVVSVLYISNILAVGRLLIQINQLDAKHQQLLNEQEMLRVQISRLASLERVERMAADELGMQAPKQPPIWLEPAPERIQEVQNAIEQHQAKR